MSDKDLHIIPPFSPRQYFYSSHENRIELLKELVRRNAKVVEDFSWEQARAEFEEDPSFCSHTMQAMKVALLLSEKDKEIAVLKERIEDLCTEIERVKKAEGRLFLFGPGTEEP